MNTVTHDSAANNGQKPGIVIVGMLFSACLILSNLTAMKVVHFWHITATAALVFFPMTYIFDDILTEVYGFQVSRRIIWLALVCNIIVIGGAMLTVYLPPDPSWHAQAAYQRIYLTAPRIMLASMVAYLIGEFFNAIALAKLKIATNGRHLWLRCVVSTAFGLALDSMVFTFIGFIGVVPLSTMWRMIITMYVLKLLYEILALPVTYLVTAYLKRKDCVDHYDYHTRFNPFSLRIDS